MNFDNIGNTLFASLIWGAIGTGYFIYGKKQSSFMPMLGGLAMIGASYFLESALWMSVASVALMIAIYFLTKMGY